MKAAQKDEKQVNPPSIQQSVITFIPFIGFMQSVKRSLGLHYSTLEVFMLIAYRYYMNGQGCTVTYIVSSLYSAVGGSKTRSIHYRLVTLTKKGFVYSVPVKGVNYYYLSDKAKGILEGVNRGIK